MRSMLMGLFALVLLPTLPAGAQEVSKDGSFLIEQPLQLLFAQTAKRMTYDGDTMTLEGPAPATLFFADRPQRLSGHFTNAEFVELWKFGEKSFAADPPNAALAMLEEPDKAPVVVELKSVELVGDALQYKIRVLDGELPAETGSVGLFIDPWEWVPPEHRDHYGWLNCHWNRWGVHVCRRYW